MTVEVAVQEGWADNHGVKLHFIQSNRDGPSTLTPIAYVHGAYGSADGFLPEMKALSPRWCVSLCLRGRGKSDNPETGYTCDHNISDVEALVNHVGLRNFCLMGWSVGVFYAIGYACRHPDMIAGLVLLDYPARHPKLSRAWGERMVQFDPSIATSPDRMRGIRGLERESSEILLWDELRSIECPVLVIGGGRDDALLKPEHVEKYRQNLRNVEVEVFENSGHNVSEPNYQRFINTLESFLERLDKTR